MAVVHAGTVSVFNEYGIFVSLCNLCTGLSVSLSNKRSAVGYTPYGQAVAELYHLRYTYTTCDSARTVRNCDFRGISLSVRNLCTGVSVSLSNQRSGVCYTASGQAGAEL